MVEVYRLVCHLQLDKYMSIEEAKKVPGLAVAHNKGGKNPAPLFSSVLVPHSVKLNSMYISNCFGVKI